MNSTLPLTIPSQCSSKSRESRWLSVVTHTQPRYGGLSTAVPRLGASVAAAGHIEMSLAAFCLPEEQFRPEGYDEEHLSFWPVSRTAWIRSRGLRDDFAGTIRKADAVHIHGLWEASTVVASRAASAQSKPYLLSVHGMLEPWALANKRVKKLLYSALLERRTVASAACLHALTQAEAEQYRAFGAKCPIGVIPNAVEVPAVRSPSLFLARYPNLRNKRVVLFLGRLHPKKGLHLLVEAWGAIAKSYPEAHLVLAGPDDEDTAAKLQNLITSKGLDSAVSFTGMLDREMKWSAFAAAEVFVLPSFSEGLSMSVLEALGSGLPVIITRNCNMPEVSRIGAGWEIAAEASELMIAIREFLRRSPEENREMGGRGAHLISSRYQSCRIAAEMAELYEFVLRGTEPRSLELLHG